MHLYFFIAYSCSCSIFNDSWHTVYLHLNGPMLTMAQLTDDRAAVTTVVKDSTNQLTKLIHSSTHPLHEEESFLRNYFYIQ
jgi:hypothetical protein